MSDPIKHECGLAFIRLRKPFSYYQQQYGTVLWGLNKLYLLMEKQHNRGQDGAGVAAVKLNVEPGYPFLHRIRSGAHQPIADVFKKIGAEVDDLAKFNPDIKNHPGLDERSHFIYGGITSRASSVRHTRKEQCRILSPIS
ncbi:MAG: hypothetical protein V9F01_03560 [Chitinophagaceae bacterium]